MSTDWQSTVFSNRHIHNRGSNKKSNHPSSSTTAPAVNIKKLFGTYTISCPSAAKISLNSSSTGEKSERGRLEIFCLNEHRDAIFAELGLPGVLYAGSVVLAGSRKGLKRVVEGLRDEEAGEEEEEEGEEEEEEEDEDAEEEEEREVDSFEENPVKQRQGKVFEKNSFRSMKFWIKWQGEIEISVIKASDNVRTGGSGIDETRYDSATTRFCEDGGYWIWSGSHGDHFSGTISCSLLGWKNVKIEGWKTKPAPTRDYEIRWRFEDDGESST